MRSAIEKRKERRSRPGASLALHQKAAAREEAAAQKPIETMSPGFHRTLGTGRDVGLAFTAAIIAEKAAKSAVFSRRQVHMPRQPSSEESGMFGKDFDDALADDLHGGTRPAVGMHHQP